jgi:hypothetical protein
MDFLKDSEELEINLAQIKTAFPEFPSTAWGLIEQFIEGNQSPASIYMAFSQPPLSKALSQLLFKKNADADNREKFALRVMQVAQSHLRAWESAEGFMVWALEMMKWANSIPNPDREILKELNKELFIGPEMTHISYLMGMLNLAKSHNPPSDFTKSAKNLAENLFKKNQKAFKSDTPTECYDEEGIFTNDPICTRLISDFLQSAILNDELSAQRLSTIQALLDIHNYLMQSPDLENENVWKKTGIYSGFRFNEARKFGLTQGPEKQGPKKKNGKFKNFATKFTEEKIKKIVKLSQSITSPFEKGRLPIGLESLIDKYLLAQHEQWQEGNLETLKKCIGKPCEPLKNVEIKRNQLLDDLVRFAQKVLLTANFDSLMNTLQANKRAEYDDPLFIEPIIKIGTRNKVNEYVQVLQAVGNSILSQVDELRHKDNYKRDQSLGRDRELLALAQSLPQITENILDKLIRSLQADAMLPDSDTNSKELKKQREAVEKAQKEFNQKKETLGKAEADLKANEANTKEKEKLATVKKIIHSNSLTLITGYKVDPPTVPSLVQHIIVRLGTYINSPSTGEPSKSEIVTAYEYFKGFKSIPDPSGKTAAELFDLIKANLEQELTNQILATFHLEEAKEKARKAFDTADIALKAKNKTLKTDVEKEKNKRKKGHKMVRDAKQDLLKFFEANRTAKPDEIKIQVNAALEKICNAESDVVSGDQESPKQECNAARNWVNERVPQMEFPFPNLATVKPPPDAKDVIDQLIATLRYEHVAAVREGGEQSGTAKNMAEALKLAYNQRSGMVHIRPALAYLRNSYPASSLQEDTSGGLWSNMLLENFIRGLPFIGEPSQDKKVKARTRAEIDKQFWQNINRVRVAGGGETNYVIAKDDIGNWYVKNYSADPEKVFKSMANLAKFGMGPGLGLDLPINQATPNGSANAVGQAQNLTTTSASTPLEKQFFKFKDKFDKDSKADLQTLNAVRDGLKVDIQNRWEKDGSGTEFSGKFTGSLDDASQQYLAEDQITFQDKATDQEKIIITLNAINLFHNSLSSRIDGLSSAETDDAAKVKFKEEKQKARELLTQVISEKVAEGFILPRNQKVQNFKTVITIIGDGANESP